VAAPGSPASQKVIGAVTSNRSILADNVPHPKISAATARL
jgi:hypothetical protein